MALNCTMTKPTVNTMPVSAIMPEATAERNAWAEATEMPESYGKYACSSRGSVIPPRKLAAAYIIGINQR